MAFFESEGLNHNDEHVRGLRWEFWVVMVTLAGDRPALDWFPVRWPLPYHGLSLLPSEKIQDHCLPQTPAEGERVRWLWEGVQGEKGDAVHTLRGVGRCGRVKRKEAKAR